MNADMVIQTERMPLMGETIRGGDFRVNPGGKGANQAAALAKLGGCVKMMGCVGADMYGDMMRQSLTQYGVQTDGVETDTSASTGVAVITVCGGDNVLFSTLAQTDVSQRIVSTKIMRYLRGRTTAYFSSKYRLIRSSTRHRQQKQNGAYVVLNPAPMCPLPDALLAATDLFVPNLSEAQLF